jgi:hypothetical protein
MHFGRECNSYLMGMVGDICTWQILTTGNVPRQFGSGSDIAMYGFVNGTNLDTQDALNSEQIKAWVGDAEKTKGGYFCRILCPPKILVFPPPVGINLSTEIKLPEKS